MNKPKAENFNDSILIKIYNIVRKKNFSLFIKNFILLIFFFFFNFLK
jgi:hypothetical protein